MQSLWSRGTARAQCIQLTVAEGSTLCRQCARPWDVRLHRRQAPALREPKTRAEATKVKWQREGLREGRTKYSQNVPEAIREGAGGRDHTGTTGS